MSKLPSATIRAQAPSQRAPKDVERLFQGLENFANLGSSFEEYRGFTEQWPTFWPVEVRDNKTNQPLGFLLDRSYHSLVKATRDYLRRVWRSEEEALRQQVPSILLGLKQKPASASPEQPDSLLDLPFQVSLVNLMNRPNSDVVSPDISVDWIRGEFSYSPLNDFQRAVYLLFRENWRARICSQCSRLFIAGKPAQLYCSVPCSVAARRHRDLGWWKTKGAVNRQSRRSRRKRSKLGGRPPKKERKS